MRIHYKKLADRHPPHRHRGSVSIQTMSIRDSFINLQQALSHAVCICNRPIQIGLADVCQPSSTQFRFEIITRSIDSRGYHWELFLLDVIRDSEFNTNLQYN